MDHCSGGVNENSMASQFDILRCPFLRNLNEPTNLSFPSSLPFPMPALAGKGPIFEDGPNFDTTFRLFHGPDGVVPLSDTTRAEADKPVPVSHPLAAKAATISLSSFGPGGPFGFDAFSEMFKNKKKLSLFQ